MEPLSSESPSKPLHDDMQEFFNEVRAATYLHAHMMNAIATSIVGHDLARMANVPERRVPDNVSFALVSMLPNIAGSLHTLYTLSEKLGREARDCYCVARSLVEAAINVCYIMAGGEEVAEKALDHPKNNFPVLL